MEARVYATARQQLSSANPQCHKNFATTVFSTLIRRLACGKICELNKTFNKLSPSFGWFSGANNRRIAHMAMISFCTRNQFAWGQPRGSIN
jgi:hypothetical protein